MKYEAACLPSGEPVKSLVIYFDEWDDEDDQAFAKALMHGFNECTITVIAVFVTCKNEVASDLCFLNMGEKIRPFPCQLDITCEWSKSGHIDGKTHNLKL